MTTPKTHHYTIPLLPDAEQERALVALGELAREVRLACRCQAYQNGTVSLAELFGSATHVDPGNPGDELRALLALPRMQGVPAGLLVHAMSCALRQPGAGAPGGGAEVWGPVAGAGLLIPASVDHAWIAGVPGMVRLGIDRLPSWAQRVWQAAVDGWPATLDPAAPGITGWASIEPGSYAGKDGWVVDIDVR